MSWQGVTREEGHFSAIVLAGTRVEGDPVAEAARVTHKCLAQAAGVPMLQRVVEALAASQDVGNIVISLEDAALLERLPSLGPLIRDRRFSTVRSGATPALSALAAIEAPAAKVPLLVTTGDHPLLQAALVERFCAEARSQRADVVVALAPATVIQAAYPDTRRTFFKFGDGRYCGCNLFAFLSTEGLRAIEFWRGVERNRKRPLRIARAFGVMAMIEYVAGRLTVDAAMRRISRTLGVRAAAIVLPVAEAAIDVDKPADLELVERILRQRG
ncbi:MAG: nucleotidyltransferase family protein [Alphaproteobacteria bacterium]